LEEAAIAREEDSIVVSDAAEELSITGIEELSITGADELSIMAEDELSSSPTPPLRGGVHAASVVSRANANTGPNVLAMRERDCNSKVDMKNEEGR
jgi:hypothetical protein